ncbi:MAG: tetratricopeptide repeat protein, partial [Chloroflexi bacterium]|nr:tetratricopeptide repeat protein [Chloroflexota bacterium]
PEAESVHRIVAQLANGGANLLLTSRQQPAGLRGEILYPRAGKLLEGLDDEPAARLFLQHSSKAKDESAWKFANEVARAAEGHPLSVALLAGEYDVSGVSAEKFLEGWEDELAAADRPGLAAHHRTFAAAFERSYRRLPDEQKKRLRALSLFPFPFFAVAASFVWTPPPSPFTNYQSLLTIPPPDPQSLAYFTLRSLLEVDAVYAEDNTPATFRMQPAMRREIARRLPDDERAALIPGYAAYGAWLARRGYLDIHRDLALNRLVRASLPALEAASDHLDGTDRLWHIRRLAWIQNAYGDTRKAFALLDSALPEGAPLPDPRTDPELAKAHSSLRYEQAKIFLTRGDLDRALALYQESLQLDEQLGDKKGKAASLHAMAEVFLTRGDLDRALALYQESLQLDEQLGDKKGKAASLHNMAQVFLTRGDLDRALALYQESLQLKEQLGDKQGKAASLHNMAQVFLTRGDLDRALALYQESLQLKEQLGDKQGKAASLHNMANILMARKNWNEAESVLVEASRLASESGSLEHVAFSTVKLGQLAQARGDKESALARYREGLALFERIGMPRESAQVREMIARLEGDGDLAGLRDPRGLSDPLAQAISAARAAAGRGDFASAIESQERAVGVARAALTPGPSPKGRGEEEGQLPSPSGRGRPEGSGEGDNQPLITLSILLYNLAGYYAGADCHDDAVRALEEVVAIDVHTRHPDLEQDRKTLEAARRLAAMTPEQRAQLRQSQTTQPPNNQTTQPPNNPATPSE